MKWILSFCLFLLSSSAFAKNYVIFSMNQDLPMGTDEQVIRKNYYINMGSKQGIKKNTILDVFRVISILNPYDNRSRVNYKVKIGEVKVLHVSEDAAITTLKEMEKPEHTPIADLEQFMVGDHVAISVN